MFDDYCDDFYMGEDYNLFEENCVYEDMALEREAEMLEEEAEFDAMDNSDLPSYHSDYAESEYQRGIAEARLWQAERRIYGDELADQWELERELRDPDPYY